MAFRIEKKEEFIEVHLWGEGQEQEVLSLLQELHRLAPRKEISDLWLLAEEYVVPWVAYTRIVQGIARLLPRDFIASKSAIVVANQFQLAQAQLYRQEAKRLPFEIGVFLTREEAVAWLRT